MQYKKAPPSTCTQWRAYLLPVIAGYACDDLRTNGGGRDGGRRPRRGAIYIFGRAEGHGLSRGNGIFEARCSRKAIIPKAVLIKAQPRYIAAMPHTPICPPPPRTSPYPRRFYRPFFRNPPATPFIPERSCVGILLPLPPPVASVLFLSISLVDTWIFFSRIPFPLPPLSLPLSPSLARACNRIRLRARLR